MADEWANWAVASQQAPPQTAAQPQQPRQDEWNGWKVVAPAKQAEARSSNFQPVSTEDYLKHVVTFGLGDKVSAATDAILPGAGVPGDSFGDRYQKNLTNSQAGEDAYVNAHPLLSKVAGLIGPMLALGPEGGLAASGARTGATEAAPTMLGRAMQVAKPGAVVGAVAGFGGAPDTSVSQDMFYTGLGGLTGAATGAGTSLTGDIAVKPLAQLAARKLGSTGIDDQASEKVFERIRQDAKAGGPTPQDMLDTLNLTPNKPLSLADVGGENLRSYAGSLTRQPGESRQIGTGFLNDRDQEAGNRITQDINSNISGGSAHQTAQALDDARRTAAQPLYEKAFAANNNIASPEIDAVLATPAGKSALATARVTMQNAGEMMGKPDATGVASGLNLQTLDYVKRALDDQIGGAQRGGQNNEARILTGLRSRLITALDTADAKNGGFYSQARAAYSGPSQSMDALTEGQSLFRKSPDQIKAEFDKLNPNDREFYKLGASQAARDAVAKTGMHGDEAKRIINTKYARDQLRPLFDSEASYQKFINSVGAENRMFEARGKIIGNSATAARAAEDQSHGPSIMGPLAQMGAGLRSGDWGNVIFGGARAVGAGLNKLTGPSPEVNAAIARKLFNPDHSLNTQLLHQLLTMPPKRQLPITTVPLSSMSGQLSGPLAQALISGGTQ